MFFPEAEHHWDHSRDPDLCYLLQVSGASVESIDQGFIIKQSRNGAPYDVSDDESPRAVARRDKKYGIPRSYARKKVLGVKVQYISRGYNWFSIRPVKN